MVSSVPAVFLFYSMLVTSTVMSVSASHWLLAWLGMELNMVCFIPLVTLNSSGQSCEAGGKYFLAQAIGSSVFLLGVAVWVNSGPNFASVFIIMGLLMKVGGVPVHQWFPVTAAGLPWFILFILLTIQKVGPVLLLMSFVRESGMWFIIGLAMINVLFGVLGGLNQTQLRPLLAYSSISHVGWVLGLAPLSLSAAYMYFGAYLIISGSVVLVLGGVQYRSIKVASMCQMMSSSGFFSCFFLFLSLAGMPPFSGFFIKAYALAVMVDNGYFIMAVFFVISAAMGLAFYMNVLFLSILGASSVGSSIKYGPRWEIFIISMMLSVGGVPMVAVFLGL